MRIRTASLALATCAAVALTSAPAHAEVGVGLFVGEPLGLDINIGLDRRSALDIVLGAASIEDGGRDYSYGHFTYLVTPFVGVGRSVLVPLRLGIGASMAGLVEGDVNLSARVPFQIGLKFRRSPIEIYGEIAMKLNIVREYEGTDFFDLDGGVGLRFYF